MTDIGLNGYLRLYVVAHIITATRYNDRRGNIKYTKSIKICSILYGTEYVRMDQLKFVEDSNYKNLKWLRLFVGKKAKE